MNEVKAEEFGLEKVQSDKIAKSLKPVLDKRQAILARYDEVIKKEISEDTVKEAKEIRLELVTNRTQGIMKWHKENKEFFLRGGQFVDAIKRMELGTSEQAEKNLLDIELHFENIEKERLEKLSEKRKEEINKFTNELDVVPDNLGEMDEAIWINYLEGAKSNHNRRVIEQEKIEKEMVELEKISNLHITRREELIKNDYYRFHNKGLNPVEENYLGKMSDSSYTDLINILHEEKANEEKLKEDQRLENEKLRKEAAEREAKDRADRLIREKKDKAEQLKRDEENLKKEAELKAERDAKQRAEAIIEEKEVERIAALNKEMEEQERLDNSNDIEKMKDLKIVLSASISHFKFKSKASKEKINQLVNQINQL